MLSRLITLVFAKISGDVVSGISLCGLWGDSAPAKLSSKIEALAESTYQAQLGVGGYNLLPILANLANTFSETNLVALGIAESFLDPDARDLILGMVSAFNFLFSAGWAGKPVLLYFPRREF